MSQNRRSFYGIAPTWIARGNGIPKAAPLALNVIEILCSIDLDGDVSPLRTLDLSCMVDTDNLDIFNNIGIGCSTTFLGDVNPIISMSSVFVVVMVSGP